MTKRDRRTLMFGAGVVAILLATARGLPALSAWQRRERENSARAGQQLAESSIDFNALSVARDTLAARAARFEAVDSLIPRAASASDAVAQLASAMEDLADSCAVRVSAIQLRPDSVVANGVMEVSARLNGVADVVGLAALVRAVAASKAPIAIRELAVTASEPSAPSTKAEALRFDVLVAGLSRITPERP
jgi:hypothetical protein